MRWLASWILYWLGDACCHMAYAVDKLSDKIMDWSIIAQGDGNGAWERADD